MGSLITALQNQNIAAANRETLGDIYAANPQNLGYTENPFEYTSSPAVIQTAYPQYGYNATAPMMPPSYEEYDLTTLFGMLQGMNTPGPDSNGYQPMVPDMPSPYLEPMVPHMPSPGPATPGGLIPLPPGHPLVSLPPDQLPPIAPPKYNPNPQPVTPAGILAQLAGEVQQQTGQTTPVPGAYTVPGTTPEPEEEEEEVVVAPAAPAMSQAEMVARNIAGPELRRRAEAASNRALPRNISRDEAFLMMNYE